MLVGKEGSIDYFCEYKYRLQMKGAGTKRNNHLDWLLRYDFLLVPEVKKCSGQSLSGRIKMSWTGNPFFVQKNPVRGNKNGQGLYRIEQPSQATAVEFMNFDWFLSRVVPGEGEN